MGKSRNNHKYDDEIEENVFVRKKKWFEESPDPQNRPRTADKFTKDFDQPLLKMPSEYYD